MFNEHTDKSSVKESNENGHTFITPEQAAALTCEAIMCEGMKWRPIIANAIEYAARTGEDIVYFHQITTDTGCPYVKNWNMYFARKTNAGSMSMSQLNIGNFDMLKTFANIHTFDELDFDAQTIALAPFRDNYKVDLSNGGTISWIQEVQRLQEEAEDDANANK